MAKFKVGDKVRIIKNKNPEYIGDIVTIKSINPNAPYLTEPHYGVGRVFVMCEDELELVSFTKPNLKDGMVVETRDGYLYLVIGNRLHGKLLYGFLNDWIDDLTNPASSDLDIVKVYTVADGATDISSLFNYRNLTLIWERKEEPKHKEMTVEEIEKELGYKIKVIADNDSSNK
jgi:hypothetical protein